jgi:hypothetical protein
MRTLAPLQHNVFGQNYAATKRRTYSTQAWALMLTAALLAFPTQTFAKDAKKFAAGDPLPVRKGRTRGAFNNNNQTGWSWVTAQCGDPDTVKCAQAAVLEASAECGDSAKFFRKGSEAWQWISFALVMASAASTAVGASTTIANTKVWSTLGGTTGLGAVTTNANANVTADQNAVVAVSAILDKLNTDVTALGTNYSEIYLKAAIYGYKCAAIANSSSGATAPQTVQPNKPTAPIIGTATPGSARASVAFTAPVSDGGAAITGYTVVANPGGQTATGTSSPITVTGLTNGTPYTFTVTATNSAGTGPASAASTSVTPN